MTRNPGRTILLGGTARHVARIFAVLLFVGCDGKQPLAPSAATASLATGGSGSAAPSTLTATAASYSQVDLAWQDNSTNESGFEVHRSTAGPVGSFTLLVRMDANATRYSNSGLTASTQYCYEVRAFRTIGGGKTNYSAFSSVACATTLPPPVPAAPTGTHAMPGPWSTFAVNWVDNSINESGFRVERSEDVGATWAAVGTVGPGTTAFSDTSRTAEQPVCYRVVAFNAGGESAPSNSYCTALPAAPTGLTAVAEADHPAIDLSWSDNSAVEDGYEVLRDDGDGLTMPAFELPANATTYRDTAVGGGTTYTYYVRAKKDGGFSDESPPASAQCIGADCPATCVTSWDCPGGYSCDFTTYICVPYCTNGVKDGDETDVDCGGPWCASCQAGRACWVNADCASGSCVNDVCQPSGA